VWRWDQHREPQSSGGHGRGAADHLQAQNEGKVPPQGVLIFRSNVASVRCDGGYAGAMFTGSGSGSGTVFAVFQAVGSDGKLLALSPAFVGQNLPIPPAVASQIGG
jgi:hypothetical protein